MIAVKIDLSDFITQQNLSVEQTDLLAATVLDEVTTSFAKKWSEVAGESLTKTRSEYQKSIYIEKIDNYNIIVGLNGMLPNMIEQGAEPFDMKEGFEKSSKRKVKKNGGWYLTIPFRFATPTSTATSAVFSSVMPSAVYQVAKQLGRNESLKVKTLPLQFQIPSTRPSVPKFGEYTHKSSIYEGMQKKQDDKGRSQYTTFRRVSDLSDPNAWIHTGITAHNLARKALDSFNLINIIERVKVQFYNSYINI